MTLTIEGLPFPFVDNTWEGDMSEIGSDDMVLKLKFARPLSADEQELFWEIIGGMVTDDSAISYVEDSPDACIILNDGSDGPPAYRLDLGYAHILVDTAESTSEDLATELKPLLISLHSVCPIGLLFLES